MDYLHGNANVTMNSPTTPIVLFSEEGKLNIEGVQKNGDTAVKTVNVSSPSLLQQATGKNGHSSRSQPNGNLTPNSTNDRATRIKHSRKTKSLYEARPGTSNGDHDHFRSKSVHGPRFGNEDHLNKAGRTETKKEESPKRLRRIQSLARSAQYNNPTSDQDQTKRNLSRLLLQEDGGTFPGQDKTKSNGKSPVKKSKNNNDEATNAQNLETINESRKTESEDQTQNTKDKLDLKTSKLDQSKDNDEQDKVVTEKRNTFQAEKKTSRHDGFDSFDVIDSDESETLNTDSEHTSNTLEPGSQKGAIASYLFSGLHTQLIPFYVRNENQERIQAQKPHIPENKSQGNITSREQKEDRHRRARSVEYDDRVKASEDKCEDNLSQGDVKKKIDRIERASSEPPETEKNFLRRKSPSSERSLASDQTPRKTCKPTASEPKLQPEELKSKMADTSMITGSVDQDVYVTQLRQVTLQNTVVYFSKINQTDLFNSNVEPCEIFYIIHVVSFQVFDSCCEEGKDTLDRSQLKKLCEKLQLGDSTDTLIEQLVEGSSNGRNCNTETTCFSLLFSSLQAESFLTFTQDTATKENIQRNKIYFIISGRVNFLDFKERFVQVLSTSMTEDLTQGEDGDTDLESDTEYSSHHYGRVLLALHEILLKKKKLMHGVLCNSKDFL